MTDHSTVPKLIAVFGGLYAAQGITGSLVQTALPTVLREAGMRLDQLGFLYLLFLPWALKFLWAPFVDRHFFPRHGRRRSWIVPCQALLVVCFVLAAFIQLPAGLSWLLGIMLAVAILAATQDTATDALAVDSLKAGFARLGGSAQVAGGYAGLVIGVGAFLPIHAAFGWSAAMLSLAGILAILTVPTLLLARGLDTAGIPDDAPRPGLAAALRRPDLRRRMAFVAVFQLGSRLGIALLGPFMVDAGLDLSTIGWLKGTGAAVAGIFGAVLGAIAIRRLAPARALPAFAFLHAGAFAALAVAATLGVRDPAAIGALLLIEGCLMSLTFVALYTAMMGWCAPGQAGTDFALLQSVDAVLAIAAGALAGLVSQHLGHGANFTLAAALLVAGAAAARPMLAPPLSPAFR